MNYPDHRTEGFKNFISIQSCTGPVGMNRAGVPVFSNGCTFQYACDTGFQPFQGPFTSISCNSGFWTARALCVREVNKN